MPGNLCGKGDKLHKWQRKRHHSCHTDCRLNENGAGFLSDAFPVRPRNDLPIHDVFATLRKLCRRNKVDFRVTVCYDARVAIRR